MTGAWLALTALCSTPLLGCAGYQIGVASLYHPRVRTVYVPMFQSDSFRRNLGERLTEAVMKEIQGKTSYQVVNTSNADSTLAGQIVAETKRVVIESPSDDPRQAEVDLVVRVSWTARDGSQIGRIGPIPIGPEAIPVRGSADFFPEVGRSVATAHQQAVQRAAEQIVSMMENPW
ncbi:MAG: LptE family protein [Planctomycetota bacterium]